MQVGDKIRIQKYMYGVPTHFDDYIVEEFRYCLGVFLSETNREMSRFTPLCELYDPAPDAEELYMSNCGNYYDKWVQSWMDLPRDEEVICSDG